LPFTVVELSTNVPMIVRQGSFRLFRLQQGHEP
jgi:hypothetical protein